MDLYLVRHGESVGNTVDYDCPDPELTSVGKRQARFLADGLSGIAFDRIFASPLIRSLATAAPVAARRDLGIEVRPDARETRSLPGFRGLTADAIRARVPAVRLPEGLADWEGGWRDPGEEDPREGMERARGFWRELRARCMRQTVLVVGHGGFNSLLIRVILGLAGEEVWFSQTNTCINRFRIEGDRVRVLKMNDVHHLHADRDATG